MVLCDLSSGPTEELLELPETGMGFQWVADFVGRRLLILNATLAYDATELNLAAAADPAAVLANGSRLLDALRSTRAQFVGRPEPTRFALLASRVSAGPISQQVGTGVPAPQITLLSALVLNQSADFEHESGKEAKRLIAAWQGQLARGFWPGA